MKSASKAALFFHSIVISLMHAVNKWIGIEHAMRRVVASGTIWSAS